VNRAFSAGVVGDLGKLCRRGTIFPMVRVVEAAGVELFRALRIRKLLILGTATTAKKAPLPDPLYVYCTKNTLALSLQTPHSAHSIHRFAGLNWEKTLSPQATDLPFPRYACLLSGNFRLSPSSVSNPRMREHSRRSLLLCRLNSADMAGCRA
jgi:hypothetical protein